MTLCGNYLPARQMRGLAIVLASIGELSRLLLRARRQSDAGTENYRCANKKKEEAKAIHADSLTLNRRVSSNGDSRDPECASIQLVQCSETGRGSRPMETAGIEPATSALQRRRSPN